MVLVYFSLVISLKSCSALTLWREISVAVCGKASCLNKEPGVRTFSSCVLTKIQGQEPYWKRGRALRSWKESSISCLNETLEEIILNSKIYLLIYQLVKRV